MQDPSTTIPFPGSKQHDSFIKIAAMNCMNLNNNYEDIVVDKTLMESSIIAFSETWLDQKTIMNINGYNAHFNSIRPGKGLVLYWKDNAFQPALDIKQEKMQLTKLKSSELEVIAVYRSDQGNTLELIQHLADMIKPEVATVICGDFNICYKANRCNRVSQFLERNGFSQLMKEATHIRGRHIDHFYFKPGNCIQENPSIQRY